MNVFSGLSHNLICFWNMPGLDPALLQLPPGSPDAKIFEESGNSTATTKSTPVASGKRPESILCRFLFLCFELNLDLCGFS